MTVLYHIICQRIYHGNKIHLDGQKNIEYHYIIDEKAKTVGLSVIAITDHDTLEGLKASFLSKNADVEIITGIEFSCHTSGDDGFDCHILGYGFDPDNKELLAAVEHGRRMRFFKLESASAHIF